PRGKLGRKTYWGGAGSRTFRSRRSLFAPAVGFCPLRQQFALAFFSDFQDFELMLIDLPLDALPHDLAQLGSRDRVQLDRGGAAELFGSRIRQLGRPCRQIPLLDLLARHSGPFEADFCTRGVAPELGLDVARGVDAGRIEVTEVIDVR